MRLKNTQIITQRGKWLRESMKKLIFFLSVQISHNYLFMDIFIPNKKKTLSNKNIKPL